ncbi:MAG: phosphoglycerate kinase [Candidatus Tectomicrobia bacterium]|uniref:Phosphoglycerate kinase n=1 Tax=Tectimicrobiota bacterium TaxID=2528274 RepID=A0A938B2C2_UNCTE|nr:phosphoglycerate kinase [Candidatus Tectomicrobia bacterium]
MPKSTLRDLAIRGKRLFVRVDFNVPLSKTGEVTDDTRIRAVLPTLNYALDEGASLVLASHLGRPRGKVDPAYSLQPVAARLQALLGKPVRLASDCIGADTEALVRALRPGAVLLLENLRFHAAEEKNDAAFAQALARLGEVYVNDAFGAAHRAHASTAGIAAYLQPAVAGLLMDAEVTHLSKSRRQPEQPLVAVLGGAKVSDKIPLIMNLLDKVSALLIGGGMAYTLLQVQGYPVGDSLVEPDCLPMARDILAKALDCRVQCFLPRDHVIAQEIKADAPTRVVADEGIPAGWKGLDIAMPTVQRFGAVLRTARTVVWNGPMGVFEMPPFRQGTVEIAQAVAACTGTTVVGGGDTIAALALTDCSQAMTHISTGGGASLEFLEGKTLPGIACLNDR